MRARGAPDGPARPRAALAPFREIKRRSEATIYAPPSVKLSDVISGPPRSSAPSIVPTPLAPSSPSRALPIASICLDSASPITLAPWPWPRRCVAQCHLLGAFAARARQVDRVGCDRRCAIWTMWAMWASASRHGIDIAGALSARRGRLSRVRPCGVRARPEYIIAPGCLSLAHLLGAIRHTRDLDLMPLSRRRGRSSAEAHEHDSTRAASA